MSMELIINGQPRQLEQVQHVEDVVRELGLLGKPLVAEVEGKVLTAQQWASVPVQPGMKIELVHFVGGG
ncbi:sulfur carrier protein ThiS [Paenibacillus sp. SYP-B4298]|uniref:sulfur carrier protein ThiS n=1 Tax=Paenibacillus sp. SYP-B4298 TaxID=2996034 RepID=UPI0022DDBCF3|nr:sulfur carrier protein ThiS [Paenibacillus sp. SYP-B4298]